MKQPSEQEKYEDALREVCAWAESSAKEELDGLFPDAPVFAALATIRATRVVVLKDGDITK